MFSVITTFVTRKPKDLPKWNCSQPQKNWKGVLWQLEMFDVCTTGDTAHIDAIFKFLPHTHVNMGASIFFTAAMIRAVRSARSRGNGGDEYCARNARCTVTTDLLCDRYSNTQKTSLPERPFSHYIHSHRLAAEMWTTSKSNFLG